MELLRWRTLGYFEQMGHIGSEIARARHWQEQNDRITSNQCMERACTLIDLTIADGRWQDHLKEVLFVKETLQSHYNDRICSMTLKEGRGI